MRFNTEKFDRDRDYRGYAYWNKELLDVLEKAGDKYPEYENGCHKFLESVKKEGKYKRSKMYYIVCPRDGSDITVELPENMDKEEMKQAIDFIINFIAVMTKHGYIID